MENYFDKKLNENTVNAVNQNAAFFMGANDSRIPPIVDSYSGQHITGANYFNLRLSNALNGKHHTEYVKMSEALSTNRDWFAALPRENRPRGTLYRDERNDPNAAYAFVMPTEELTRGVYRNNRNTEKRAAPDHHYVPFQSSNANMDNFSEFVHEQFTNAINASLTGCPFRNNIHPHEVDQFKTRLINEISRNPAFMTMMANNARDEALEFHRFPFDRNNFLQRARDETSPEFARLNAAIGDHVRDIYHSRKPSFNPEFTELSRPLVIKIENLYMGNPNPQSAVNGEVSDFVKRMIQHDRTASIIADTFAGTFIEKAMKLVRTGKRIFAGIMLAGALCNNGTAANDHVTNFCRSTAHRMGGESPYSRIEDFIKVAGNIMVSQELKGNNSLKTCFDINDSRSFYACLHQTIRDNPQTLDQAIAQVNNSQQNNRTQSMSRGQAMRR